MRRRRSLIKMEMAATDKGGIPAEGKKLRCAKHPWQRVVGVCSFCVEEKLQVVVAMAEAKDSSNSDDGSGAYGDGDDGGRPAAAIVTSLPPPQRITLRSLFAIADLEASAPFPPPPEPLSPPPPPPLHTKKHRHRQFQPSSIMDSRNYADLFHTCPIDSSSNHLNWANGRHMYSGLLWSSLLCRSKKRENMQSSKRSWTVGHGNHGKMSCCHLKAAAAATEQGRGKLGGQIDEEGGGWDWAAWRGGKGGGGRRRRGGGGEAEAPIDGIGCGCHACSDDVIAGPVNSRYGRSVSSGGAAAAASTREMIKKSRSNGGELHDRCRQVDVHGARYGQHAAAAPPPPPRLRFQFGPVPGKHRFTLGGRPSHSSHFISSLVPPPKLFTFL